MRSYDAGISSVRYPRDTVATRPPGDCPPFVLAKARPLNEPCADLDSIDAAVLAFGTPALAALDAAAINPDLRVAVYDARFAKPVDRDLLRDLLARSIPVLTIEDHSIIGGFGAAVLQAANDMELDASRVTVLALPDRWIHQDSRAKQLAEAGLDAPAIARAIRHATSPCGERASPRA
jgi:1-deoxy-D-xylulose-5-phosphate synthase